MYTSTAGTVSLRAVARLRAHTIATSARRRIAVRAADPPPPPVPPFVEPTTLPAITGAYPQPPPNVPAGTGVTALTGWQAGQMLCSRDSTTLRVFAPTPDLVGRSGYYDYYLDVVMRWDGSAWSLDRGGSWAYQPRGFSNSWTYLGGGQHMDQNAYQVSANYRYAVAQYLYDGQLGGFWTPLFTTYLTGAGTVSDYICRPG